MVGSNLPCTFKSWSDASSYRTVADSYTKTDVDGLIPDVSGLQTQAGLEGAVATAGFLKSAGVLSAVAGDGYIKATDQSITSKVSSSGLDSAVGQAGYLKSAGVLSAVSGDGYIKANNQAITAKANSADVFLKANTDLNKLFRALQASLALKDPDNSANDFDWSGLLPI